MYKTKQTIFSRIIICFVFFGLLTGCNATNQPASTASEQPVLATLTIDYSALAKDGYDKLDGIKKSLVEQLIQQASVNRSEYYLLGDVALLEHKAVGSEIHGDDALQYANLIGVNNEVPLDIELGNLGLLAGRTFSPTEMDTGLAVGIISAAFAQLNQLQVGDLIPLDITHPGAPMTAIEVIGIIDTHHETLAQRSGDYPQEYYQNLIYLPHDFVLGHNKASFENFELPEGMVRSGKITYDNYGVAFTFTSPEAYHLFAKKVKDKLPKYYQLTDVT